MTTIAWDGKTLASDSRATGDFIKDDMQKIYKVGSIYFGVAGTVAEWLKFLAWAKDRTKEKPSIDPKDGFTVIEIKGGKAFIYESSCCGFPVSAPYAIGSGCQIAMTAMYLGKTAKEAVQIAKKFDEGTGGKVKSVNVEK